MRRAALMRLANQIVVATRYQNCPLDIVQEAQLKFMYFGHAVDVCKLNALHVLRTKLCRANRKQ